MAACLSIAEQV